MFYGQASQRTDVIGGAYMLILEGSDNPIHQSRAIEVSSNECLQMSVNIVGGVLVPSMMANF